MLFVACFTQIHNRVVRKNGIHSTLLKKIFSVSFCTFHSALLYGDNYLHCENSQNLLIVKVCVV